LEHELELERDHRVIDPRAAGIGSHRNLDAGSRGGGCALEHRLGRLRRFVDDVLLHTEIPAVLRLHPAPRERGHEVDVVLDHRLDLGVSEPDAVLNRVDACLKRVLDSHRPHRVREDAAVRLVRLFARRGHFLERHLGSPELLALGHDASGCEQLDPFSSALDLLAGTLARLVSPVDLETDVPAVSAGHDERYAADEEPRALDDAGLDRVLRGEAHSVRSAGLPQRGDPGCQQATHVARAAERHQHRIAVEVPDGLAVEADVVMEVDDARYDDLRREIQDLDGPLGKLGTAYVDYELPVDEHDSMGTRGGLGTVDQCSAANGEQGLRELANVDRRQRIHLRGNDELRQ